MSDGVACTKFTRIGTGCGARNGHHTEIRLSDRILDLLLEISGRKTGFICEKSYRNVKWVRKYKIHDTFGIAAGRQSPGGGKFIDGPTWRI